MLDKWVLYYHKPSSRSLAEFLCKYSDLASFKDVTISSLPNTNVSNDFAQLPRSLRKVLFYGHPDVVLAYDNGVEPEKAVFAWEITDAVPATDHWMQRFSSLVGACELGVPSVFILPFESNTQNWKGTLGDDFFYAYDRVMEIQQMPIYLAEWAPSASGQLTCDPDFGDVPHRDSGPMVDTINFLNKVVNYAIHGKDFHMLMKERLLVELRNKIRVKIQRVPLPQDYNRLTVITVSGYCNWKEVKTFIKTRTKYSLGYLPQRMIQREKSIIFVPRPQFGGKRVLKESLYDRIHKRNGNPYNGMPLAFDFLFCRLGKTTYERDVNLILDLSELTYKEFIQFAQNIHNASPIASTKIPSKQASKLSLHLTEGYTHEIKDFIRQYCYAADLIILKDFIIPFE